MTARKLALTMAKVAGYHADTKLFTRLVIESRVARHFMDQAWFVGVRAKEAGARCECGDCRGPRHE